MTLPKNNKNDAKKVIVIFSEPQNARTRIWLEVSDKMLAYYLYRELCTCTNQLKNDDG